MLATHPHAWTSVVTKVQEYGWNRIDRDECVVHLKDTSKGKYRNVLLDSVTFRYELPGSSVIDRMFSDAATRERYTVHLFGVQNARDHFLGAWAAVDYVRSPDGGRGIPYVTLRRLVEQPAEDVYAAKRTLRRSRNENAHESILARVFPDFHVLYEPECQTNIGGLMVKDGVRCEWAGDSYTIDFILCSRTGCRRIAIESKYDAEAVTDATLEKCRALRDRSGQRVVVMVGSGDACRYLDMGPPRREPSAETWHGDAHSLRLALGA